MGWRRQLRALLLAALLVVGVSGKCPAPPWGGEPHTHE